MIVCLETSQPTLPVFKQVYKLYFKFVMPIFGKLFAKSKEEYEWLQQSTFNFPDKTKLKRLFEQAGFSHVKFVALQVALLQCTLAINRKFY